MFHSRLLLSLLIVAGSALIACSDDGTAVDTDEDTSPPALASVTAIDELHIDVKFNERVRRAPAESIPSYTITEGVLRITAAESPGDTLRILSASLKSDQQTVALTTESMEAVPYELNVAGITDLGGNSGGGALTGLFTGTNAADTSPPELVYRSPGPGATGVAVGMPVGLQFSEPVYVYGLSWSSGAGPVSHTLSTPDNVHYAINQDQPLAAGTTYTVELTGVQDDAGNAMDAVSWSFRTAGGGDVTPPTFVSSNPAHSQTNVNVNANLSITFSEPIDQTDFEIQLVPDAGDGDITFTGGGRTLVFDPDYPLLANQQYEVTILAGGVKDLAGNGITDPVYITFTTASAPGYVE